MAARWSFEAWKHEFPNDTVQTYLDQYALAADPGDRLVEVYCALDSNERLLGLTTLVDDDELPGVVEPGPWIAAVWVNPDARLSGVGGSLVRHATLRAHVRGVEDLYLYTEDQQEWYQRRGWKSVRDASLNGLAVTVMTKRLSPTGATA
jgi:GNAT superfamily N-acetyltransferase